MPHSLEGNSISSSYAYQKKRGIVVWGNQRPKRETRVLIYTKSVAGTKRRMPAQRAPLFSLFRSKPDERPQRQLPPHRFLALNRSHPSQCDRDYCCPLIQLHFIVLWLVLSEPWAAPDDLAKHSWCFCDSIFYSQLIFKLTDSEYNRALHSVGGLIQSEGLNQRERLPHTPGVGKSGFSKLPAYPVDCGIFLFTGLLGPLHTLIHGCQDYYTITVVREF